MSTPYTQNPASVVYGPVVIYHHEPPYGWWAESPQLPGCYAAAATREECERLWDEARVLWGDG